MIAYVVDVAKQEASQLLISAMNNFDVNLCVADDGNRMYPTIAIIKTDLQSNLLDFLALGNRKLGLWGSTEYFP